MTDKQLLDMSPEEFRQWGYRAIDWIAEYLAHPEGYDVLPQIRPGAIRASLPGAPPETGEPMARIFEDFEDVVVPGVTHWNHPDFFAYFASSASGPGIVAEALTSALNLNAMLWKTSPAATELEETVLDWLRQMLGLPEGFRGVSYDTASVSTFHALAAARGAIGGWNVREEGLAGPDAPRLRMYASEQAHSSVEKAAIALGVGQKGVVKIPADAEFRMDVRALEEAIVRDQAAGRRPFAVVATVGTTSTTSVDPVEAIAAIAARHGLWLHVDAAYAGAAAILPERRALMAGIERADSFVMNPHKWLFVPVDSSVLFSRRADAIKAAFSLVPEYLRTAEDGAVTNYMDYGIQLGRRFRALKLWMVIRYFGVEGLRSRIREHIRLAGLFASWVEADPRFELMAPTPFSTVCFRLRGSDAANQRLLDRANATGALFMSHTRLHDRLVLRFTIGNLRTSENHVVAAWRLLASLAEDEAVAS